MGRKERREREQKRARYASKRSAQKRKNLMIAGGVLGVVAVIVGWSAYTFATLDPSEIGGAPSGAGLLNSAHTHTGILVKIFGDTFPFHETGYQIQSPWIHFENHDGTTIHKHATGITLGFLFDSLDIHVDEQCYVFPNRVDYCTNDEYTLHYYINGEKVSDIRDHEPMEEDRILIVYGDETEEEIAALQMELDQLELVR